MKRRLSSLISTLVFVVMIVVINILIPFFNDRQDIIDIIITAVVSGVLYYFITYYLIGVLEKRQKRGTEE
ncbi:MAG: hypothetical protein B6226_02915 [Candidatus Cloacimonetes bacterium 4572_65]|nr:MAG: hypothetical protein B6226_02915 [Candidatus Cloacimonetes bacterium 4572_65]